MKMDAAGFPAAATAAEFEAVARDEARLAPGAAAICERHGLAGEGLARFADGSLPVYAVGERRVLKLYPPCHLDERDRERLVLETLAGRLPVPTPEVEASGELDGWGYVLMSRLRGETMASAWPRIEERARRRLAASLGTALAALHELRDPRLAALGGDWDRFVREQRASAADRQRARRLDESWIERIPGFLAGVTLDRAPAASLLHTEVMREHLLVSGESGEWVLTGMYDFEPSMVGAREYEFASVGLFVSCGEAPLLRELLLAYGYRAADLDAELQRRLLAYALLHRYSYLRWYMERVPPPAGTQTMEALAAHWWRLE